MRLYLGSDANVVSAHFYGRDNRTLVVIHQDGKNRLLLYQLINKYRVLLYIWHQMSSTGTGYAKLYFTVINNKINKLKKNIHSRRESMSDQRGYSYWSMCSVGASLTGPDYFRLWTLCFSAGRNGSLAGNTLAHSLVLRGKTLKRAWVRCGRAQTRLDNLLYYRYTLKANLGQAGIINRKKKY